MNPDCPVCPDGGDTHPEFNDSLNGWGYHCDSCGWERPATMEELREILCLDDQGIAELPFEEKGS